MLPFPHASHNKIAFEPLVPSSATFIASPLNRPDPRDSTPAFIQSVELLAQRYLNGHRLHIRTSALRGPFDQSWANPWHQLPQRHSPRATPKANDEAPSRAVIKTTRARLAHEARKHPCGPASSSLAKHATSKQSELSSTTRRQYRPTQDVLATPPRGVVLTPKRPQLLKIREELVPRHASPSEDHHIKNPCTQVLTSSLPTPSESGRSQPADDEPELAVKSALETFDDQHSVPPPRPAPVPSTTTFTAINRQARSVSPAKSVRHDLDEGYRSIHNAPEKRCLQCQSTTSKAWRKGPAGPGTLCLSCGGKWVHQQKRALLDKAEDPQKASRRKYGNYKVRRESIKRASEIEAKRGESPTRHHQRIYDKIFPGSLKAIELDVNPRAVDLRQKAHSSIEQWSQPLGQPSIQTPLTPHSRLVSPRKEKPRLKLDQCDIGIAKLASGTAEPYRSTAKRRRLVNFDTPKAHFSAQMREKGHDGIIASDRGYGGGEASVSAGRTIHPIVNSTSKTSGNVTSLDSTLKGTPQPTAYQSTQMLMQDADEAFRHDLSSTPQCGDRRQSLVNSTNARFRLTSASMATPKASLPEEEWTVERGKVVSPPTNTQDLFSRVMTFDSSPAKKSVKKKRASFAPEPLGYQNEATTYLPGTTSSKRSSALRSYDEYSHDATASYLHFGVNGSQGSASMSPMNTSANKPQQDAQQKSSPFDLDTAIDLGKGFLEN